MSAVALPAQEGDTASREAELEQKIILGQRHGNWKWALNLVHATEWEDDFAEYKGELEFDFGLARELGSRWAVGFEVRGQSHIPGYDEFEDFALLRVFGRHGTGVYPTFQILEKELKRRYGLQRIGLAKGVKGRFYAISVEKKVRHPAVAAICDAARRSLFSS